MHQTDIEGSTVSGIRAQRGDDVLASDLLEEGFTEGSSNRSTELFYSSEQLIVDSGLCIDDITYRGIITLSISLEF